MRGTPNAGQPVRALVLGRSLLNGGTEKQSVFLARALGDLGFVELVCLYDESDERMRGLAGDHGVEPVYMQGSLLWKVVSLIVHVRRSRINLVLATLPVTNLVAAIVGCFCQCIVVGGFRTSREPRRLRLLGARVLHAVAFRWTVANSQAGRDFLITRGFHPGRVRVFPNAIDASEFRTCCRTAIAGPVRVITVARMVSVKNYALALQAFAQVRETAAAAGMDVVYDIVGYGPEETQISRLVAELGLGSSVTLLGRGTNIGEALANADVYLSTSHYEGTTNSVMEAMSASLPVVSTPAGDAALVLDGTSGFVSVGWDPADVAELVIRLASDEGLRRRMGAAARERVMREYSLSRLRQILAGAMHQLNLEVRRAGHTSSECDEESSFPA